MQKIDAHQHFWEFDPVRDSWIGDDMAVIRRDFLPHDLQPLLKENGFDGSVVVQSDQTEKENLFQLANAEKNDFIKGVVGWIDLQAKDIEEQLAGYRQFTKLKGFRHILQGEADRALMLKPDFKRGISHLNRHGYTYDILIFPDQIEYARELIADFPDQPFVIDHIAKPAIREQKIAQWEKDIRVIGEHENAFCKISGMVTEADWKNWKEEDFRPYMDVIVETFGTERILFGSDWPVCLVAASYRETVALVSAYFSSFSAREQAMFFGGNATRFYNLGGPPD